MEKKKTHFTNEELAKKFKSNFELVSYAIKLAENMIKTGRDARVKSDIQNRAMLVLEEINEGKDRFDEIKETTLIAKENQLNGEAHSHSFNEGKHHDRRHKKSFLTVEHED